MKVTGGMVSGSGFGESSEDARREVFIGPLLGTFEAGLCPFVIIAGCTCVESAKGRGGFSKSLVKKKKRSVAAHHCVHRRT